MLGYPVSLTRRPISRERSGPPSYPPQLYFFSSQLVPTSY